MRTVYRLSMDPVVVPGRQDFYDISVQHTREDSMGYDGGARLPDPPLHHVDSASKARIDHLAVGQLGHGWHVCGSLAQDVDC